MLRGDVGRRTAAVVAALLALSVVASGAIATAYDHTLPPLARSVIHAIPAAMALVGLVLVLGMGRRIGQVQEALDATQAAIAVYDAHDRLVIVNQSYRDVLDVEPERFVPGAHYGELVRRSLEHTLDGAELERELVHRVDIHRRADGTPSDRLYPGRRWVRVTKSRTPTGLVVGVAIDVTANHELKEALENEVRRFEALAAGAPVGICQVSETCEVQFVNGALLAMLGVATEAELATAPVEFRAEGWSAEGFGPLLARLRESDAESEVSLAVDGETRSLLVRKALVTAGSLEARVLPPDRAYGENIVIFIDITERQRSEARIRYLAHHDVLTDALNRLAFADDLAEATRAATAEAPAALIAIDLDRFKPVNDVYGHAAGDELLRQIVRRLSGELPAAATLYRMGGDEFAVLVQPGAPTAPLDLARRLVARAAEPFHVAGHAVIVGASAGVSVVPGDTDTGETLIHYADLALYQSKRSGGGAVRVFDKSILSTADDRHRLEVALVDALETEALGLVFQPVVAADRRRCVGAEVLARWPDGPGGAPVPPSVFIPIAEKANLIGRLDRQIFARALAEAADIARAGDDGGLLFVNMSARTLAERDAGAWIAATLRAAGVPGSRIVVELTESFAVRNADVVSASMHEIAASGVRFAIDDFGTGYTSLRLIATLPISFIKLDRSFVRDLGRADRPRSVSVVRAIVDLAHTMGVGVIAEGVETEAELTTLAALSCDYVQGDLLSPPLGRASVGAFLARAGEPRLVS